MYVYQYILSKIVFMFQNWNGLFDYVYNISGSTNYYNFLKITVRKCKRMTYIFEQGLNSIDGIQSCIFIHSVSFKVIQTTVKGNGKFVASH